MCPVNCCMDDWIVVGNRYFEKKNKKKTENLGRNILSKHICLEFVY